MKIQIDPQSGYCFGVEYAIQMAEDALAEGEVLYCLGDIVHNNMEVERLNAKGLRIIDREDLKVLKGARVLIRAHGEPPETYKIALENQIELIDASCPVVLKLQNRVKHAYDDMVENQGQIVIYGQPGHAEVIGINGQTNNEAIVITQEEDLAKLDFTKPITLFSQTTKSTKGFYAMRDRIAERMAEAHGEEAEAFFSANDSICRQVSNREPQMRRFSEQYDVIIFVSGKKSSNGKALFSVCQSINTKSYFIESEAELDPSWFEGVTSVGICGATSTPNWLMEQVATAISNLEAVTAW